MTITASTVAAIGEGTIELRVRLHLEPDLSAMRTAIGKFLALLPAGNRLLLLCPSEQIARALCE